MFSAKKNAKPRDRPRGNLAQFGLIDIPTSLDLDGGLNVTSNDDDENDSDLEAELAILTGENKAKPRNTPKKKVVPQADLDAMVAESMKNIPSDEELSGDDDPELLNELSAIAGGEIEDEQPQEVTQEVANKSSEETDSTITLLNNRLKMYEEAEKNAKAANESSRARRFNRGIKTLKDLIRQANAGKPINNEDIPPEVSTGVRKPVTNSEDTIKDNNTSPPTEPISEPSPPAEPESQPSSELKENNDPVPTPKVDTQIIAMLTERKDQYKIAALKAKQKGDKATAINYIKIMKQFETVIAAAQNGQPIDISKMPEAPPDLSEKIEEAKMQNTGAHDANVSDESPEENLIAASSVLEALEQRLSVYKQQETKAKESDNASKARRMGRIVKQYEQAIKLHKAGKPIPVDELPTPPGYAPIPVNGDAKPKPAPTPASVKPTSPATSTGEPHDKPKAPTLPPASHTTRPTGNQVPNSRAEKQLALLLAKQKQFKEAALNAKRRGEIQQAKEFLRTAKGFEPLINAATCGLPVDLSTLPISPAAKSQLDNEYDIVMTEECTSDDNSNMDVLTRLENQLTKQLKMCLSTRDHYRNLGDVAGTNRFERLALNVTKDLDLIRLARRTPGAGIPKFHYENKDFSIVKSFTELNDNELEVTIVRGICYTCSNPKDIDTYVKFEFPYPQDESYSQRTSTVKDTNSPEYNATFVIPIQRTARACQRVFKRQSVKFEVYSKGGFFRGDTLLGTATVKLQPLETQCELHDSFELLEGRKKVGGKLEVRFRLRHPIVSQQIEQIHEKWLVIDT